MLPQPRTPTAASGTSSWSTRSEFRNDDSGVVGENAFVVAAAGFYIDRHITRVHLTPLTGGSGTIVPYISTQSHPYSEHQWGPLSGTQSHGAFIWDVTWSVWVLAQRMEARAMETMFTSFQGWKLCHCTVLIIWPVSPNVAEHKLIHQISQWAKSLGLMPWAIWLHLGHFQPLYFKRPC